MLSLVLVGIGVPPTAVGGPGLGVRGGPPGSLVGHRATLREDGFGQIRPGGGFGGNIVPGSPGGLATCGNAHGKLVDALADRVPRQGAGSVVVGLDMIDCKDPDGSWIVRAVPAGSSAARERHHESIRSEQQST